MAAVTDCARECFRLLENDPAKVATTEYNAFALITHPAYAGFLAAIEASTVRSVYGKAEHFDFRRVRVELYTPADETNAASTKLILEALPTRVWQGRRAHYGQRSEYAVHARRRVRR